MNNALLIRADGSVETVAPNAEGRITLDTMYGTMDASTVDVVSVNGVDVWFDDDAPHKPDATANLVGSYVVMRLANAPLVAPIVGPMLFAGSTPDGDTVGLPQDEIDRMTAEASTILTVLAAAVR